jgi:hypothetical protein
MATFPVVCLDASPSTTPLMVTLAAFEVEATTWSDRWCHVGVSTMEM